jgi:hypothetical protein
MLPGGQAIARPILAYLGRPGTTALSPASRASIGYLLGSVADAMLEPVADTAIHQFLVSARCF